jgi:hypothetical protein
MVFEPENLPAELSVKTPPITKTKQIIFYPARKVLRFSFELKNPWIQLFLVCNFSKGRHANGQPSNYCAGNPVDSLLLCRSVSNCN